MKMYLISHDMDTCIGFRLAGVEGVCVQDEQAARRALQHVVKDSETAIVLVTETIQNKMAETIHEIKINQKTPLIVEIPDKGGASKPAGFITDTIKQAIGIKI